LILISNYFVKNSKSYNITIIFLDRKLLLRFALIFAKIDCYYLKQKTYIDIEKYQEDRNKNKKIEEIRKINNIFFANQISRLLKVEAILLYKKDTTTLKQIEIKLSKIIDKTITKSKIYTTKQNI
jgi:hypothetical protein